MKKIIAILAICVFAFAGCKEDLQQYPGFNTIDPLDALYPAADLLLPDHTTDGKNNYAKRIVEFKTQPLKRGEIIFLGNGLIELGGNWATRLGAPTARNRGITNDLTFGVLQRLKEITHYKPSYVFIEIGIEDLMLPNSSPSNTADQISEIVKSINKESAQTKIYVNTVFPTRSAALVSKIRETNTLLQTKSLTEPFDLIDTYTLFAESNGLIKSSYAVADGIHLTEPGYNLWVNMLAAILGTTPPVVGPPLPSNVALNRPVTVNGTENATTTGDKAVDGDMATLWSSAAMFSQTLAVELSAPYDINKIVIFWEGGTNHYASAFNIEASDNGTTWRLIASATGVTDNTSYTIETFTGNKVAKYVRFVGQGRRSTYYRIREFEVYGTTP
ncbi:MAG: discoidin domain-containing protein [Pedobacter sp.]|uniref:discoidin domain-containing protein n=1 Tax=Pedobacter sp. TaxID=1411316 RepID=UPI002807A9DF|nr:discoidin domain-containing protein [Pedobacter sp.]MDQ8004768.1 discoidin domain-containing protein [Pedobacter sp.]